MVIAKDMGIKAIERPVDKSELLLADEVFLCGTAARIVPVKRLENYQLPSHRPITEKLREKLTAITENREHSYSNWVYTVSLNS